MEARGSQLQTERVGAGSAGEPSKEMLNVRYAPQYARLGYHRLICGEDQAIDMQCNSGVGGFYRRALYRENKCRATTCHFSHFVLKRCTHDPKLALRDSQRGCQHAYPLYLYRTT